MTFNTGDGIYSVYDVKNILKASEKIYTAKILLCKLASIQTTAPSI